MLTIIFLIKKSIFYLRSIIDFLIKLRLSLIDRIYTLTMKKDGFHCQKEKNRKINHRKMKRSIIYDRKSMIGSKNRFLILWQRKMTDFIVKKKKIEKSIIGKWKDRSYMTENLWPDRKINFWGPINPSWSKIDFSSTSLYFNVMKQESIFT